MVGLVGSTEVDRIGMMRSVRVGGEEGSDGRSLCSFEAIASWERCRPDEEEAIVGLMSAFARGNREASNAARMD